MVPASPSLRARAVMRAAARRVAQRTRFSRAPLGLRSERLLRVAPEVTATADRIASVELTRWTTFCDVLFMELRVDPLDGRRLAAIVVVFADVAVEHAVAEHATGDLAIATPVPASHGGQGIALRLRFDDGSVVGWDDPAEALSPTGADPGHGPYRSFAAHLSGLERGRVVELGARARSGNTYRDIVPERLEYVGVDVLEGPNVDVVGDAHDLAGVIETGSADAVFAISVFEHLLMPWKAALEINRVLRPGGVVFVGTHQTFPLHDAPWDFWRFSDQAWRGLFNEASGFRVLEVAMGGNATVVPDVVSAADLGASTGRGFLMSSVLAEKLGETALEWPVGSRSLVDGDYPA